MLVLFNSDEQVSDNTQGRGLGICDARCVHVHPLQQSMAVPLPIDGRRPRKAGRAFCRPDRAGL